MLSLFSQFIFGTGDSVRGGLFFGSNNINQYGNNSAESATWKDRNLCFDIRNSDLQTDHGEQLIGAFFPIEDVKGNPDELGVLKITNLRLIWIRCDKKRMNLSIGWRSVTLVFEQNFKDSVGNPKTSLCVIAKHNSTKYEFIFSKLKGFNETVWSSEDENWRVLTELKRLHRNEKHITIDFLTPMYLVDPYEVVMKVWWSYKRTTLFRQCRSNLAHLLTKTDLSQPAFSGSIANEFNRLPSEEILDNYTGITQEEPRNIKYIGLLILTNIRIIWVDLSLPLRNLSVPYIRVESIKLNHGDKILITTYDYLATANKREFKIEKAEKETRNQHLERSRAIFDQLKSLLALNKSRPRFGPESCDDCQDYLVAIRPIEHFLQGLDDPTRMRLLDNLGPTPGKAQLVDPQLEVKRKQESRKIGSIKHDADSIDAKENELIDYRSNLNIYLDDRIARRDIELVYVEKLGLATERPADGTDLDELWNFGL